MLKRLLSNHVLANLTFLLVLFVGTMAYLLLPRQQDPTINFNWIAITTALPGASALDVEQRVTLPLEDSIRNIADIRFASSNSREGISSLLVRFEDISEDTFDSRLTDLRREIQNARSLLPSAATDPYVLELTSSSSFPSVTLAVVSQEDDDNLRVQARNIEKDLEKLTGVDRVDSVALDDPEIQVSLNLSALEALALNPNEIADSIALWFRDISAGSVSVGEQSWLVRLVGREASPEYLANLPIVTKSEEVTLGQVASVQFGREKASQEASMDGKPAIVIPVMKKDNANTIELVDRIKAYMEERNALSAVTGVTLVMVDDQTIPTSEAISMMQSNALIGLLLVLVVAWLFLGFRIAALTAIGIPFVLAATFWILWMMGETLNVTVLLAVVIVLGMLVDDAVVVVEAIHYHIQRGANALDAALMALSEVGKPVIAAVLTTMAAFLPLMLLPGILGEFMRVIPMVVTLALALSLVEAFWMLPSHVISFGVGANKRSRGQRIRRKGTRKLQRVYLKVLVKALRYPWITLLMLLVLMVSAGGLLATGKIKLDFFASDPLRLFYVNVEMPAGTPLATTLTKTEEIEAIVREQLTDQDIRAVVTYAGQMFTQTEPYFGNHYGQVLVGLLPKTEDNRDVDTLIESIRGQLDAVAGPVNTSFLRLAGGPPTSKPISIKVRGDDYQVIAAAAAELKVLLAEQPYMTDIGDDAGAGRLTLNLTPNFAAIDEAGISPNVVSRAIQLLVDGEVVADMQHQGEKLEVRAKANGDPLAQIDDFLNVRLTSPTGAQIPLSELVHAETEQSLGNIRHYNFRRAITVEADIAEGGPDTVAANKAVLEAWHNQMRTRFPSIDLDTSGELDDIQESMDAIGVLFLFGIGLMYLILGTQFGSYFQPILILATVPMAFTGVVAGLFLTQNPMSLYTLYGVVALAGIAVNSAIVLISAANERLEAGMSLLHATLYAARRRVIPVVITSLTTIAGLFSLATGLGGHSLLWGPVAAAIVSGLIFSTLLTLIMMPIMYRQYIRGSLLIKRILGRLGGAHG